jgi:hypothetical protein
MIEYVKPISVTAPFPVLSKSVAPIVRLFEPVSTHDHRRIDNLLSKFLVSFEDPPSNECEAHASIACKHNDKRCIIRIGSKGTYIIKNGEKSIDLEQGAFIYDVAILEGKQTDVILRWALEAYDVFSPKIKLLRTSPNISCRIGVVVSDIIDIIEIANKQGLTEVNNRNDFMPTIPKVSDDTHVFFGGRKYG